jgi:drug/metabolite transporter (DMT)-like permease
VTQTNPAHPARGVALLSLTTFIWGSTFVITRHTLDTFPANELILCRFLIAGVIFAPFLRGGWALWRAAVELGVLLSIGFATQTIGLSQTTISRCAFITSLHVVMVPVLSGFMGRRTRWIVWLAALIALCGVFLLSNDGSPPNRGDGWTFVCAIAWATYIARMETFAARFSSSTLTAAHVWVVIVLMGCWTATTGIAHGPTPWAAILYLGLFATAATTWFQTMGQKWVTASQAAVLYTLEPVWASLFALVIMGQMLGTKGWIGGAMILAGALLTQLPIFHQHPPPPNVTN